MPTTLTYIYVHTFLILSQSHTTMSSADDITVADVEDLQKLLERLVKGLEDREGLTEDVIAEYQPR